MKRSLKEKISLVRGNLIIVFCILGIISAIVAKNTGDQNMQIMQGVIILLDGIFLLLIYFIVKTHITKKHLQSVCSVTGFLREIKGVRTTKVIRKKADEIFEIFNKVTPYYQLINLFPYLNPRKQWKCLDVIGEIIGKDKITKKDFWQFANQPHVDKTTREYLKTVSPKS